MSINATSQIQMNAKMTGHLRRENISLNNISKIRVIAYHFYS